MNAQTALFVFLFILNLLAMVFFYLFLRSRFSQKRILSELRAEVDKLIVDLGREADRDVAILESRIKNLRALIDEADRRILVAGKETARRKEEIDILETMGRTPDAVRAVSQPVARTTPSPREYPDLYAQVYAPQAPVAQHAPVAPPAPQSPAALSATRTEPAEPVQIYTRPVIKRSDKQVEPFIPVQERVVDMARKGFSAELISGTLSMPLGEVELILDMNSSSL